MSDTMRERVAKAIHDTTWVDVFDDATHVERAMAYQQADAAITAVITALVEQSTQPDYMNSDQEEWLRQFLPASDTEETE